MLGDFFSNFRRKRGRSGGEISPDEIFLDSANLPQFEVGRMEGRMEKAISARSFIVAFVFFVFCFIFILARVWILQINKGEAYNILSERNALRQDVVFATRGIIHDRVGELLVSNSISSDHPDYPSRKYPDASGMSHILGYVKYPAKDTSGIFYSEDYVGKEGAEFFYNSFLAGLNGVRIREMNALGLVESESVIKFPVYGGNLRLSIDSRIQNRLYEYIEELSLRVGFRGGAGVIVDVTNGEIIALTSFPEFDSEVLSDGLDSQKIAEYVNDENNPFLNRIKDGLYAPGSIVKPFLALAALEEGLISPEKKIYSSGSLKIPNPYNPSQPSVFGDWKAHGYTNMKEAIAVSSDVYFYVLGGGFEDQKGLGIDRINKYMRLFGFGASLFSGFFSGPAGTIPNPEWKAKMFDGEAWRLGDTYNTSIGQYGFQVTPLQAVMATAALASDGVLFEPTIVLGERILSSKLNFNPENFQIVKSGMRQAVLSGTAAGLNVPFVEIAAKTGTAEIGSRKELVNSWVIGFFPYENPKYAFTVIMEKGPSKNTIGALYVMRQLFEWINENSPEYFES